MNPVLLVYICINGYYLATFVGGLLNYMTLEKRTNILFGRFPGFARLSYSEQHVGEDEHGALVE